MVASISGLMAMQQLAQLAIQNPEAFAQLAASRGFAPPTGGPAPGAPAPIDPRMAEAAQPEPKTEGAEPDFAQRLGKALEAVEGVEGPTIPPLTPISTPRPPQGRGTGSDPRMLAQLFQLLTAGAPQASPPTLGQILSRR